MADSRSAVATTLLVVDAMDHPHGGRILRARVSAGGPPSVGALEGSVLTAVSPAGATAEVRVLRFPLFGGRPSDDRIRRTGRVDLLVEPVSGAGPVDMKWELRVPSP